MVRSVSRVSSVATARSKSLAILAAYAPMMYRMRLVVTPTVRTRMRTLSVIVVLLVGCSHSSEGGGHGYDGGGDAAPGTGSGPVILQLSTNSTMLAPDDQLVVTAVVTHPGGIAQVIGGSLADPGGGTYGAFQVSTTGGAWSLTIPWGGLQTVADITSPLGGESRAFAATFFDQGGHSTTKTLMIHLGCGADAATHSLCSGKCFDLQQDPNHCGTCGTTCSDGGGCEQGQCATLSACVTGPGLSCDSYCSTLGKTCANTCGGGGEVSWFTASCFGGASLGGACSDSLGFALSYKWCCSQ